MERERIIQLRMPGFIDARDIEGIISMIYESCILVNYSEKETNNSLLYQILNSFYNKDNDGVEKTTRAEFIVKKDNQNYGKYYYKYANVYCDIDNSGIKEIDDSLEKSGYTKVTYISKKSIDEEVEERIKELYEKISNFISKDGGYILDFETEDGKKVIKSYKGIDYIDIEKFLSMEG